MCRYRFIDLIKQQINSSKYKAVLEAIGYLYPKHCNVNVPLRFPMLNTSGTGCPPPNGRSSKSLLPPERGQDKLASI